MEQLNLVVSCTLTILMTPIFSDNDFEEEEMKNYDQEAYADPEECWEATELVTMFVQSHQMMVMCRS